MKMDIQSQQMQDRIAGATLGNADAYYAKAALNQAEQAVQQSEVQRQTAKLLETAEMLDAIAAKLIARIEGVTRSEPPSGTKAAADGLLAACPVTSLGRTLDSINSRIRNTMASLQSTIQRIEL
jgi:hypothetical protein